MIEGTSALDGTLAALADPQRRRVVELLRYRPRSAGELARELAVAPPAMSRHLRVLRRAGLVREEHPEFDARVRIYSLQPGAMRELGRWVEEVEAMWTKELASLRDHLENNRDG